VQSPQPTRPSSLVSILTNVHGLKPPSTMNVRTLVILRGITILLPSVESPAARSVG